MDMDVFLQPTLSADTFCESWSETDEEEEEEEYTAETAQDAQEEEQAQHNHEVVRAPQRAFHKRQVRVPVRFTYDTNWIKNGGEREF
jgi:hypothetical protein